MYHLGRLTPAVTLGSLLAACNPSTPTATTGSAPQQRVPPSSPLRQPTKTRGAITWPNKANGGGDEYAQGQQLDRSLCDHVPSGRARS